MSRFSFTRMLIACIVCSAACESPPTIEPRTERLTVNGRDIILILDVSKSAIDSWPRSPLPSQPPSFLDYEIGAARTFLAELDPDGAAVGIIAFSGGTRGEIWENPQGTQSPAWTEAPLTGNFDELGRILTELNRREPEGSSDMAAAIHQGIIELGQLYGAKSTPHLGAHKSIVVLSDDIPTRPYGPHYKKQNLLDVRHALDKARRRGIECHIVGLGPDAKGLEFLDAAVASTRGTITHVQSPEQLTPAISSLAEWLSPASLAR